MADTQRYNFEQGKLADWVKVFSRTSSVPLDRSQLFDSYADALAYAQGDGSDYRGIGKTAWVGQPISVVENNVAKFYIISEKSTVVNGETVVERVLESVGSGVIVLENFTIQSGNIVEAAADKVGSLVYITAGSAAYPKGLYIITGANKVAAFATPDNLKIVKKETANSGASATYELQLNGVKQGVAIDIPKDLVVSSGSIVTFTDNDKPFPTGVTVAGTYIKLTLANSGGDLYINVNSLVDVYTTGDTIINVEGYKISVNVSNLVSKVLVDTTFVAAIENYLTNLETKILGTVGTDFVSKTQLLQTRKYEVFAKPNLPYIPVSGDNVTYEGEFIEIPLTWSFTEFSIKSAKCFVDTTLIHTQNSFSDTEVLKIPLDAVLPFIHSREIRIRLEFNINDQKLDNSLSTITTTTFVIFYPVPAIYTFETSNESDNIVSTTAIGFIKPQVQSNLKKVSIAVDTLYFNEGRNLGILIPKSYGLVKVFVKSNGFTVPIEFWKEVTYAENTYNVYKFTTISGMVEISNVEIEVYLPA